MHLLQLFLPLHDNAGAAFPPARFARVRSELTEAFGGVTAYQRAPVTGLWEDEDDSVCRDELVLFEVMVEALERDWWRRYATELAVRFGQEEILVRALPCEWL
jgi:hypothetical protein